MSRRSVVALALTALASAACSRAAIELTAKEPTPASPDDSALALSASDHTGAPFELAQADGEQATIVIFYRGHW